MWAITANSMALVTRARPAPVSESPVKEEEAPPFPPLMDGIEPFEDCCQYHAAGGCQIVLHQHYEGSRGDILRCKTCNCGMTGTHSRKGNRRYRYYLCHHAQSRGWRHCPRPTLPAGEIERFVVDEIRAGHVAQDARLPDLPEHYGPFLRLIVDTAAGDREITESERKLLVDLTVEIVDTISAELVPKWACRCRAPAAGSNSGSP